MSEVVLKQSEASERSEGYVVVRGGALGFAQEIQVGRHRLQADEPIAAGGTDIGPTRMTSFLRLSALERR